MITIAAPIFQHLATKLPDLKLKLRQARMDQKPDEFVRKAVLTAFYMAAGIVLSITLTLLSIDAFNPLLILIFPVTFFIMYLYMLKLPEAVIAKKSKEISKEIIFAGRFLTIELQSGVPLYNALQNLSKNYQHLGMYVREIIDKVDLGSSMEEAMDEAAELIPSEDFRKILWQMINSLKTGSDLSYALSGTIDQISKKQSIEVSKYGKKLNPMAMFYMMIAVIAPSLGMAMLIILSSFIALKLTLGLLLFFAGMLGFVQFMFLSTIKFSRPPIDF